MKGKCDGEVASCGVPSDDDVRGRESGVLHKVAVRGECIDKCGRERVCGRMGRGYGETVVNSECPLESLRVLEEAFSKIGCNVRWLS